MNAQVKKQRTIQRRTKSGRLVSSIKLEELQPLFHLPSEKAAERLGVGITVLKRVCRIHGIPRWPYVKQRYTLGQSAATASAAQHPKLPPTNTFTAQLPDQTVPKLTRAPSSEYAVPTMQNVEGSSHDTTTPTSAEVYNYINTYPNEIDSHRSRGPKVFRPRALSLSKVVTWRPDVALAYGGYLVKKIHLEQHGQGNMIDPALSIGFHDALRQVDGVWCA